MKRVVVKVGTKVIAREQGGLNRAALRQLVEQITALRRGGCEVILVSSGAVGAGRATLALPETMDLIARKQLWAATGQVTLMQTYASLFRPHHVHCAQILVTKEDFRDRLHYFNMKTCLENSIRDGIIPIINENDVVAVSELVFTDNDELTGLVASMVNADAVIILTSVPGVLDGSPHDPAARVIPQITVEEVEQHERHVRPEKSAFGRGGMLTKFAVAKKLALQGIPTHIALGSQAGVLEAIVAGEAVGTQFVPARRVASVKRRLANAAGWEKGAVYVNSCAEDILRSRTQIASLLPIGITQVEGDFAKGDIIEIKNATHQRLGFGVSRYPAERVREMLGLSHGRAVIHYDTMFIE